ncbi:helix-turn-helix domain-containing protein [Pseudooceanicola sp. GBMRC 2024]|uniref:Helix-turn-helix domain-containing protein n=1 Tax=Pseudooceanicola albus TaxID=2692189 RepID=A0A6L7G304_9RHOB|nr:helix-turn-helix domain-containing protein [Pseudooceanicola albus]MXN17847.1 helix-turn-helix domain-containing protein [Pseudooceanicola albus]
MTLPLTTQTRSLTTIDSAALPARDRFAFWDSVISDHFCPASNRPASDPLAFRARIAMRSLGSIGLSDLGTAGMSSSRSRTAIRRTPLDCFFVSCLSAGEARIEQGGRRGLQKTGDFIMYDSAQPFEIEMVSDYAGKWLRVPRSVMLNRMPHAEAMTARPLSGASPMGRMLTLMLTEAQDLDVGPESPAAQRVGLSLVDLLAAAFDSGTGMVSADNARHAALLDKAKSWILAHLEDPEIDSEAMVRQIGVSRRTLNRIFALEGTTPIRWMWHQRLNRAHELLVSGGEYRVSDVALKCGFSDFSHFARAFKAAFGVMPKTLLARPH